MMTVAPAASVASLVALWSAKYPELQARLERAAALVANVRGGGNHFVVEGSDGHLWTVRVNRRERTSSCTCPDHQNRSLRCKHILAVALVEKARA